MSFKSRRWALAVPVLALGLFAPGGAQAATVSQTYQSATDTGTTATFVVPAGVTSVQVQAVGGKGGDDAAHIDTFGISDPLRTGGFGALLSATLPVTPGETLYVYVAGNGIAAQSSGAVAAGGANGGGSSGAGASAGGGAGGGGGASDVRTVPAPASGSQTVSLNSRLLVAGGGGGAADASDGGSPGNGDGGAAGQPGSAYAFATTAQPGTANPDGSGTGGAAGSPSPGTAGSLGLGGNGGTDCCYDGAGGGAGLYGGGGGASYYGQSGAGGSSWVESAATSASAVQIDSTGHPAITISYTPPAPPPPAPAPAASPAASPPPPPPPPPVAPVLSGLSPVHRCVTDAALLPRPGQGAGGLAFSLSLSEPANVMFSIMHRVGSPGRTRCPQPSGHTIAGYRQVALLQAPDVAGPQTNILATTSRAAGVARTRRLGRGRHRLTLGQIAAGHLAPGTYVLLARATNSAGQRSADTFAKFWVLKKP